MTVNDFYKKIFIYKKKREMSKKIGIMSTLYNTNKTYVQTANFIKFNESNMTKELCLEINAKLQALLEDTLIKNITLKVTDMHLI